ncbi:hypothetical protein AVEN_42231-1 [Araneus ventricosus]|uniref:Uncharacterized protein n=1 Tax=Araneus ventricosus TaxID=182803 RepID=A0A4Y2AY30_ARAVE|nr:hypothetical protein AVEN_42231-1 [Araneus ventricosus]
MVVSEDRHSLDEEAEDEDQSHTCHSCKLNFDSLSEYLEHLSDDCMTGECCLTCPFANGTAKRIAGRINGAEASLVVCHEACV